MATQLQLRRGTTAENNAFTGAIGEVTVDTDTNALRVHDGSTTGGFMVDTVVAFQAPTAQNNYTWYRKYASGWVEQGKALTFTTTEQTTTLPITMANTNYSVWMSKGSVNGNYAFCWVDTASTVKYKTSAGSDQPNSIVVCGMAAQGA